MAGFDSNFTRSFENLDLNFDKSGEDWMKGHQEQSKRAIAGVAGIVILSLILNIAIIAGGIAALIFGILHWHSEGFTFWNLFWTIFGGVLLLSRLNK